MKNYTKSQIISQLGLLHAAFQPISGLFVVVNAGSESVTYQWIQIHKPIIRTLLKSFFPLRQIFSSPAVVSFIFLTITYHDNNKLKYVTNDYDTVRGTILCLEDLLGTTIQYISYLHYTVHLYIYDYTWYKVQGCGSGSGLDPDSIGSVDPDQDSESGSGSRRAKMTHKSRNFFLKFMFWSVGWPLLRAEGFFCNLDILFGGLGTGKLEFFYPKKF